MLVDIIDSAVATGRAREVGRFASRTTAVEVAETIPPAAMRFTAGEWVVYELLGGQR